MKKREIRNIKGKEDVKKNETKNINT